MLKVFKNKIIVFYTLSIFIISSTFLVFTFLLFKNEVTSNSKKELVEISNYIENLMIENVNIEKISKIIKNSSKIRITLIDTNGVVFFDSEVKKENLKYLENHASRKEVKLALEKNEGISIRKSPTLKLDMMYYARLIKINGKDIILRTAIKFDIIKVKINEIRNRVLTYFIFTIITILVMGIYFISKITYPFEKIIYASKEFAKGNFSHQIYIDFKGELKKLAQTLNTMAKSISTMITELKEKNTYLKMLIENIKAGVCLVDEKNNIIDTNKNFSDIFNIKDVKNKKLEEFCFEVKVIENLNRAKETKEIVNSEIKINSNNRFYYMTIVPLKENKNIVILYDITEIKQLELMKKELFANISHEFKTPITVIKSAIETILSNDMDKETLNDFLLTIDRHITRLNNLTRDIIELNFIELGKVELKNKNILLRNFVEKISTYFTLSMKQKKINFINEVDKEIKIMADEWVLEKVFTNLFDNAIKFNKENGYVRCYTNKEKNLKIIFENTGEKIPPDDIERIFERFYKPDKSRTPTSKGSGLGLSIVKHSLTLYNATIKAENFEEGVRFIINWQS